MKVVIALLILGVSAIPTSFDWRDQGVITSVKDQQYCNSGYAFAGVAAMESFLIRQGKANTNINLSEQDIVDCSYKRFGYQNSGCDGGEMTAVFQYFNVKDIVLENEYPYTSGRSHRHSVCRIPSPLRNEIKGKLNIKNVKMNEDQMIEILMNKGPLVIAIANDYRSFNNLGDGIFDDATTIHVQPNQYVLLIGFGEENGKPYWIIKNSWGTSWGKNGYGKIVRGKNMCNLLAQGVWYIM
jgi:C1A family cysteine protease